MVWNVHRSEPLFSAGIQKLCILFIGTVLFALLIRKALFVNTYQKVYMFDLQLRDTGISWRYNINLHSAAFSSGGTACWYRYVVLWLLIGSEVCACVRVLREMFVAKILKCETFYPVWFLRICFFIFVIIGIFEYFQVFAVVQFCSFCIIFIKVVYLKYEICGYFLLSALINLIYKSCVFQTRLCNLRICILMIIRWEFITV